MVQVWTRMQELSKNVVRAAPHPETPTCTRLRYEKDQQADCRSDAHSSREPSRIDAGLDGTCHPEDPEGTGVALDSLAGVINRAEPIRKIT